METVTIRARVHHRYLKSGKRDLRVVGTLDESHVPAGARMPFAGTWLVIELPAGPKGPTTMCRFLITSAEAVWSKGTERWELDAETMVHETLVTLALVHNWKIIEGRHELSKQQQELLACEEGTCSIDHQH